TGQTTLISGETLNLIGAQVKGKGVAIDANELNIESLQDQAKFNSKQENISGQVTAGTGVSGSASYSKSKINADYASVNEQSGILAGDDGYQINIQGNTDLKGGLITSTQLAENANKNQLMTGTLTSSDIDNHAEYKGSSVGVGMSGAVSGGWDGKTVDKDGNATKSSSSSQGYGSDKGSDSSSTHSGINTGNIIITDAEGQQALTGKSVQETIDQIKTDVTTDTAAANSGHIGNNFDKDKVQKELNLQREVMEEFSKNTQRAQNLINTKQQELLDEVEKLQAKDKNDPRIAELLNEAKNWQTGGLLLDSVAGVLSGPNTNGAIGTIANAGKPWLASEIGQYFKQESNKDKTTAQVLAHTILGGAIAAATGNDALSGALAAGGAEALAPTLTHFLYGKKLDELSADEKQTISSIISLGGAGVGALVGGSGSDAVSGGQLAGNAVDNNYLSGDQMLAYGKEIMSCSKSGAGRECYDNADRKYDAIHKEQEKAFEEACKGGLNSPACVSHRTAVMSGDDAWDSKTAAGMPATINKHYTELYDLGCGSDEACRTRMANMDILNVASFEKRSELIRNRLKMAQNIIDSAGGNFSKLSKVDQKLAGEAMTDLMTLQGRGPNVKDSGGSSGKNPSRNNLRPNANIKLPIGYTQGVQSVTGPSGGKYLQTTYGYKGQPLYTNNGKYYTFSTGKREQVKVRNNPDVIKK
ncbi:MAG: VENN motif pre-toxin domain-containing protein, partial [Neisseriaceae bacterium]|nr:VENN motif pre-toxin domain-containing protein [Neisseriaceae bacterium]